MGQGMRYPEKLLEFDPYHQSYDGALWCHLLPTTQRFILIFRALFTNLIISMQINLPKTFIQLLIHFVINIYEA